MTDHPDAAELADAGEGLLTTGRAAVVADHLERCARCRQVQGDLALLSAGLRGLPPPAIPPRVVHRLDQTLLIEQRRRQPTTIGQPRSPRTVSTGGLATRLLVAAGLVVAVGAGGYHLGTVRGWVEPPAGAATISTRSLDTAALDVLKRTDLAAHPFSAAWWCARSVVDGRITELAGATVDGSPALLVYSESPAGPTVSVVRDCAAEPVVVDAATLPR